MSNDSLIHVINQIHEIARDEPDDIACGHILELTTDAIAAMGNVGACAASVTGEERALDREVRPLPASDSPCEITDTARMRSLILGSSLNAWAIDGLRASRSSFIDDWEKQHKKVVDAAVSMLESVQHEFYKRGFNEAKAMYSPKPVSVSLEKCAKALHDCRLPHSNWDEYKSWNKASVYEDQAKAVLDAAGVKYVE